MLCNSTNYLLFSSAFDSDKQNAQKVFKEHSMKSTLLFLCLAATAVNFITADVYLHSPRGSNNRLNEKSANRKNANRVFDSQVCVQNSVFFLYLGTLYPSMIEGRCY